MEPTLFCDTALARRIERAESDLIAAANASAQARGATGFLIRLGAGVASFAGAGSPYNKVAGLGFDGVPGPDDLESVERAFSDRGATTQVELAHLADPAIGEMFSDRGYRLESFENVLGRSVEPHEAAVTLPDVDIRPSPQDELEEWLEAMAGAVAAPDDQGLAWHEELPRATYLEAMRDGVTGTGMRRYAATTDGRIAGGAELRIVDGIAQMAGAATVPAYRRRGIQNALLAARLADASTAACDLAVIVTQPGSKSHQNAQRQGFHLLYTRAVLVKPPTA